MIEFVIELTRSLLPANVELTATTRDIRAGSRSLRTVLRHSITAGTLEMMSDCELDLAPAGGRLNVTRHADRKAHLWVSGARLALLRAPRRLYGRLLRDAGVRRHRRARHPAAARHAERLRPGRDR